jgi:hypothetical protein
MVPNCTGSKALCCFRVSRRGADTETVKIFINYRRDDVGQAAALVDHVLCERFGAGSLRRGPSE